MKIPSSDPPSAHQIGPDDVTWYSFTVCIGQVDCQPNIHWVYVGSGGLLTKYSFTVCRGQVDCWSNIHSPYAGIRWITEQIFIHCLHGSGGLLTKYSFTICRGQVNHRPHIRWLSERVRRIADRIFIHRMQGSGGLLTKYSFTICGGQVDCWPNIHSPYAGVRGITNWIFSDHWWACYLANCGFSHFSHFLALSRTCKNNHMSTWHVMDNTWPFPTHSNTIRSFPSDILIMWSIVWFNHAGSPSRHFQTRQDSRPQGTSKIYTIGLSLPSPSAC